MGLGMPLFWGADRAVVKPVSLCHNLRMPSPRIEITVEFMFSAAHRLPRYDGPCRNVHGHNYRLWVTAAGGIEPVSGMSIDFGDLQAIVKRTVLEKVDH